MGEAREKVVREAGVQEMDGGFRAGPTRLLPTPAQQPVLRGSWRQSLRSQGNRRVGRSLQGLKDR